MVDRQIVYQGATPRAVDQLLQSKNTMIGLGYIMQAVLGTSTLVDGLACTPNSPAALNVLVAPGSIYSLQNVDNTAYGIVAADTADQIVKQGVVMTTATLSCPAPGTAGQSIVYLLQATYQDQDTGPLTLAYYNASNPSSPFNGPNNTGVSQNTVRQGVCVVQVKTGIAAATGSQVTPTPDAGYVGLWAITVANGQTTITAPNIVQYTGAPFISYKLTQRLAAANNLSEINSASTARANLGLGTAATQNLSAFLQPSNNLSDVGSASTSRTNLGLGSAALLASTVLVQTMKTQTFNSSGTYTPSAGMLYCIIEVVGGGGAGGSSAGAGTGSAAGAGGGAGGYARGVFSAATIGASQTITVGAGGASGAAGNNPGNGGGNTSVGALISGNGGAGGNGCANSTSNQFTSSGNGGAGGASTGGQVNTQGTAGSSGISFGPNAVALGGAGGSSFTGQGGQATLGGTSTPGNSAGGGDGGGGAGAISTTTSQQGGTGTHGVIYITEFCNQ